MIKSIAIIFSALINIIVAQPNILDERYGNRLPQQPPFFGVGFGLNLPNHPISLSSINNNMNLAHMNTNNNMNLVPLSNNNMNLPHINSNNNMNLPHINSNTMNLGSINNNNNMNLGPIPGNNNMNLGPIGSNNNMNLGPMPGNNNMNLGPMGSNNNMNLGPMPGNNNMNLNPISSNPSPNTNVNSDGLIGEFGQCGGLDWDGPKTCQSHLVCLKRSKYYSQCVTSETAALATRPPPPAIASGNKCYGGNMRGPITCATGTACFIQTENIHGECKTHCPPNWFCAKQTLPEWAPCGGEGYTGLTKCKEGLQCYPHSRWYHECRSECPEGWKC